VKVYSKALDKSIHIERVIGKITGETKGPTIVFFGGIHGNETAGVFALNEVLHKINPDQVNGVIYGISGNLKALNSNQRYIEEDLNRLWLNGNTKNTNKTKQLSNEKKEQEELNKILKTILEKESGPYYFIDLHTTSGKTRPFITINDALINRKFSKLFPVPIILGIEEFLDGPLLSYINQLGYVSLGFESGQHNDKSAVTNCAAFIYLSLVFSRVIEENNVLNYYQYYNQLKINATNNNQIFEVVYLHKIKEGEVFKIKKGFKSFQTICKGQVLAISNKINVISPFNAKLFMPLNQKKGKEGFFIIKKINPIFLKLSEILRKIRIDNLLIILPGITWKDKKKGVLKVNLKVAKYMVKPIFHLLGYRNKQYNKTSIFLLNRERVSKNKMYKNQPWYK
jgi:succinylglutamate desuccinylase/aspartoacylase family protein